MGLLGISSWASSKDDLQEGRTLGGKMVVVLLHPLHLDAGKPPGLSLSCGIGSPGWSTEKGGGPRPLPHPSYQNLPLPIQGPLPFLVKITLYSANYCYWQPSLNLGME